jgi:hypothetical protein
MQNRQDSSPTSVQGQTGRSGGSNRRRSGCQGFDRGAELKRGSGGSCRGPLRRLRCRKAVGFLEETMDDDRWLPNPLVRTGSNLRAVGRWRGWSAIVRFMPPRSRNAPTPWIERCPAAAAHNSGGGAACAERRCGWRQREQGGARGARGRGL